MKKHYYYKKQHVGVTLSDGTVEVTPLSTFYVEGLKSLIEKIDKDGEGILLSAAKESRTPLAFKYRCGMSGCYDFICKRREEIYPNDYRTAARIHVTAGGKITYFEAPIEVVLPMVSYIGNFFTYNDIEFKESPPLYELSPQDILRGVLSWDEFVSRPLYYVDCCLSLSPVAPLAKVTEKEALSAGISVWHGLLFENVNSLYYSPKWGGREYKTEEGTIFSMYSLEEVLEFPRAEPYERGQKVFWPNSLYLLEVPSHDFSFTHYYHFPRQKCGGILVKNWYNPAIPVA